MVRAAVLSCAAVLLCVPAFPADPAESLPSPRQDWIRVETENFSFLSNAGERRTVSLAQGLEQLREVLQTVTGGLKLNSAVETRIFVFKNGATMKPYALDVMGGTTRLGGFFRSTADGNYVVVDASAGERPFRVVYHEYLHFVMQNTIPELPLWLDEGLAEFYSTFEVLGGKAYVGRALREHVGFLQSARWLPLEQLILVDHAALREHDEEWVTTVYAQSWALTHYLLASSEQQRGAAKALFALIRRGAGSREALEQAYGPGLAALEKNLQGYVRGKSGEFGMYIYTPEEAFEEKGVRVSPVERADLLVGLGDLLSHGEPAGYSSAREHLRAALELDETLALAHTALARVEIEEEQIDEALARCAKALALDASDPRAHAMYGEALLRRFLASEEAPEELLDVPPPALAEAREHFRQSLALAPDHLPSLVGLGTTYLYTDEDLSEAVQAFARASQLLPSRGDFLAQLIVLTARSGNLAGATTLLERGLRPRGDAELTRQAESGVAEAALEEAYRLASAGEMTEAAELLERALEQVRDPEYGGLISSALQQLADHQKALREEEAARERMAGEIARYNQAVELYNLAVEKAGQGKLSEAAALLQQVAAQAEDPELRSAAEGVLKALRDRIGSQSPTDRYHQALRMFWADDYDGATEILRGILRGEPDQRLRQAVQELIADIEAARAEQR